MFNKKKKKPNRYADYAEKNQIGENNASTRKVPFAIVESYKMIRTNLLFLLAQTNGKVIAISSSSSGEGKSTTAINAAIAFSQIDSKVLLIDADLRRSSIHKKLKLDNTNGLSNVIANFSTFDEAVTHFNPNLDILTAGPFPPNPSELLGSVSLETLLQNLRERYDYIIIDTPPINVVSDALVITPKTDGLVLIFRDMFTPHDALKRALAAANFANINVLGAIMNGSNPKTNRRYSYRKYSYGYKYRYGGYGGYGYGYGRNDYSYGHNNHNEHKQ